MQSLGSVWICEVHSGDLKTAFNLFRTVFSCRLYLIVRIEDVEESFRIDKGVVHLVEDAVELCDRSSHVSEEHDVVHDLTYGHSRVFYQHEIRGKDDDQHCSDLPYEAFHSVVVE